MAKKKDYAVGYKKPPAHTRFRKGRSGNPKGRPKGAPNAKTALAAILGQRVAVTDPTGRKMRLSALEALFRKALADAFKDDIKQRVWLLETALKLGVLDADAESGAGASADEPPEDAAILDAYLTRRRAGGGRE